MTQEMQEHTNRERILAAAAQEFAERGFDGARVDTIAKRAGVNKALIYYYYKSKEELLALLFSEVRDTVVSLIDSLPVNKMDFDDPQSFRFLVHSFLDLLEERQNVIRLMIMETAKRTPINRIIFTILAEIMEHMLSLAERNDVPMRLKGPESMVAEFFTGIMPILDYVAYHEIWMERFGIEEAQLRGHFIDSFLGTHFAYTILPGKGKTEKKP